MNIDLQSLNLNQNIIDQLTSGYQDFGPQTPFSDWRNTVNELARESEEEVAERAIDLYNEVDPGRGRAAARGFGTGSTRDLAFREIVQEPAAKSWMEVYEREGLSPYKLDPETGEKFYINTPPGVNLVDLLEGEDKQEYLDLLQKQDFEVRASDRTYNVETGVGGIGAGNYGTVIRAPEVSGADRLKGIATPVLASVMLGPLAGKIAGVTGLGATGTAALSGGLASAATGADPLTGALTAGLTAGIDPFITGADLGTAKTALARGATSAAIAEATDGDPLAAGLMTAGMSFVGDTLAEKKQSVKESILENVDQISVETDLELPDFNVDTLAYDIVAKGTDLLDPYDDLYLEDTIKAITEDIGTEAFNNLSTFDYREQLLSKGGQKAVDLIFGGEGAEVQWGFAPRNTYFPSDTSQTYGAIGSAIPDYLRKTVADPIAPAGGATVPFDLESLPPEVAERLTLERIRANAGGGGGGAPVTEVTAPAMTSTFAPTSAPAMTMPSVTPAIAPPSTLSSGSLAGATLLPIAGLLASAATAPTSSVATTGGGATAPAGGQISGQADSTEPSGEGDVGTDTAGTEVAGGGEGGTGGGETTGAGTGDGAGSGDGTGRESGVGRLGTGAAGSITKSMFSDYLYGFERPQILELTPMFEPYQAPSIQSLFKGIR